MPLRRTKPTEGLRGIDGVHGNYIAPIVDEEFDKDPVHAGWAWAGAPFITPAAALTVGGSILRVQDLGTAAGRAFYYRTGGGAISTSSTSIRVASKTNSVNSYVGIRYDDGTDNNYAEVVWRHISAGTYTVQIVDRTGGGAVTSTSSATWAGLAIDPATVMLYFELGGTRWTNWTANARVLGVWNQNIYTGPSRTGKAWTPTRIGWIMSQGGTSYANWNQYYCHHGYFRV